MILMPSERVMQNLVSNISCFTVDIDSDKMPNLIYKNRSLLLKRFSLGQTLIINLYKIIIDNKNYLLCTHQLENHPDLHVSFVYSHEEYESLLTFAKSSKVNMFLFDETNSSQAGTQAPELSNNINIKKLEHITFQLWNYKDTVPNYKQLFNILETSLHNKNFESMGELKISCTQWVQNNAFFLTNTGQSPKVSILNKQEGQIFNDQVAALLIRLFDNSIFLNPQAQIDKNKRELTDIICLENDYIVIIETKVQSVFEFRNPDKINASIIKNIDKAINQLTGANNWLEKKCKVFDNKNNVLTINSNLPTFNIILVSEYPTFDDDDTTFHKIKASFDKNGIIINILDMQMLEMLIKASRGDKKLFLSNLIEIFKLSIKNKTLNIGLKFPEEK